jgi:hypothetical protein
VEGPDRPFNFVATRSADRRTVYLKAVNPTSTAVEAEVRLDGDLTPRTASLQLVAPGGGTVKNSLVQPDNIKPVLGTAILQYRTVKSSHPASTASRGSPHWRSPPGESQPQARALPLNQEEKA